MNPKERMKLFANGMKPDRIPFMPTIFEHSAAFIGRTPSEAAMDEKLLEEAQVRAYEVYGHDSVIVGMDVYNIEAEALGCRVKYHGDRSVPGICSHPFKDYAEAGNICFSPDKGRIAKILAAALNVKSRIGNEVNISVGISGPFSISAELLGFEAMILDILEDPGRVHSLLKAVLSFQKAYCAEILKIGAGIVIFESWAALPLVSPAMYREFAMPYEAGLIGFIKDIGEASAPLVIGGDTAPIVDDIISTGTTLLVADYKTDLSLFIRKAACRNLTVRGNIDPKLIERGPVDEIVRHAMNMTDKAGGYDGFVLGTGVLPYNTPMENVLAVRRYLESM